MAIAQPQAAESDVPGLRATGCAARLTLRLRALETTAHHDWLSSDQPRSALGQKLTQCLVSN
jgi:hypothetical protein